MTDPEPVTLIGRLPLVEEVPRILRRRRVTGTVRVAVTTEEAPEEVQTVRRRRLVEVERVPVERVPVEREVEAPPPVRDSLRRTEVDVDENAAANDPARPGRTGRTG